MERDPNDINPNWKRPSSWKYKTDWDSPNWKRWRHEANVRTKKLLEKHGFALCPKCNTQHTALTFMCRECSFKVTIPKDEIIDTHSYKLEVYKKMTGTTVLIKQGKSYLLGKVRHTGYDVKKFFKGLKIFEEASSPAELWRNYLNYRRKDYSEDLLKSEIMTDYDDGFSHDFIIELLINDMNSFYEVCQFMEELIKSSNPHDGYLCEYSDYFLVVDFDKRSITYYNG